MSGLYVVGDIHGCLEELQAAVSLIQNQGKNDPVIFVGDYIDRGPNSKGVVDLIMDLQKNDQDREWIALMGNHEDMFLNDYRGFMNNGGMQTLLSYGPDMSMRDIPDSHMEWFRRLYYYYEVDNVAVAHAGIPEKRVCRDTPTDYLVWNRDLRTGEHVTYAHTVHGHTPMKNPVITKNVSYIDTGCVFGYYLTVLYIPNTITPDHTKFETFRIDSVNKKEF